MYNLATSLEQLFLRNGNLWEVLTVAGSGVFSMFPELSTYEPVTPQIKTNTLPTTVLLNHHIVIKGFVTQSSSVFNEWVSESAFYK